MNLIISKKLNLPEKYSGMLENISVKYPAIQKATSNFNKTHSQFDDRTINFWPMTDLRSARQCLAEIKKSKLAMDESFFSIRKKQVEIKRKNLDDELEAIEAQELEAQIANIMDNVQGAVRRVSGYIALYEQILKKAEKAEFTEEDFEKDEERHHIMTAFNQALSAARAHGGVIDEGNHIYLNQIGINGTVAQLEINAFFGKEKAQIEAGEMPTHENQMIWLNAIADKYAGSAARYAESRGFNLYDKNSLHQIGE